MDFFNIAFSPACPSLSFFPKELMDIKECLMDSFHTPISPACPSHPFVTKGLMASKGCPIDSFNIFFSPACLFHRFVPKGLMNSKGCLFQWTLLSLLYFNLFTKIVKITKIGILKISHYMVAIPKLPREYPKGTKRESSDVDVSTPHKSLRQYLTCLVNGEL